MQPQAFDDYASSYDDHFTNSLIGTAQRKQVYRHVWNTISLKHKRILEVNCGTGKDACWLADHQAFVLATDISAGMLEVAKKRLQERPVELLQLAAQDIEQLQPLKFQSIFSNFGGLNCLSPFEFEKFKSGCVKLQTHKDHVTMVIMGTRCLWEKLYFNRKKNKVNAKRRLNKNGVATIINQYHLKTYYYSPAEIKNIFRNDYKHLVTRPIGLFVPPSYLEPYFKNRKTLFAILVGLDKLFGRFSFLANYADHYIIIFEKK